jgi:hypothetical protein
MKIQLLYPYYTVLTWFWYLVSAFVESEFEKPKVRRKVKIFCMKRWMLGLELTISKVPDPSLPLFSDPKVNLINPWTLEIPGFKATQFKVRFHVAMECWDNVRWQDLSRLNAVMYPKQKIESLGGTPLDHNELVALCLEYPDIVKTISEKYEQDVIAIGSCIQGSGLVRYAVAQISRINPYIRMRDPSVKEPRITLRNVTDTYSIGTVFAYKVPC